ncbi:MAG: spore maturation protein [Angelakisella sp.]
MSSYIIPLMIGGIFLWGLIKGVDVFNAFLEGAGEGLRVAVSIAPALICLLTAVAMFRSSGAMELLIKAVYPLAQLLGLPGEILPLALMRPLSGSGAMVIFTDILEQYGPDSFIGRVASVIEGSTETTFYTIAVYYGATRVKNTGPTLAASLTGDLTGMIFSVLTVGLFLR